MLPSITGVVVGLALLVWGSERFVLGASAIARNSGLSPLIIGLTVVGIGTSTPEIFVSATAALNGNPAVAVGNAVGSNIANIGLVVGATALVMPLSVHSHTLKREFVIMFVVLLLGGILIFDHALTRSDGFILLAGFVVLMGIMFRIALSARRRDPLRDGFDQEIPQTMRTVTAVFWLVVGLLVLLASSRLIVWGAINIARAIGVSDLIIGLTIVAVGTSLPELAASVMGACKGEPDIAIGNVIGSNMFNLLLVLPLPGLIAPGALSSDVVVRDYPIMIGLSVLLFLTAYGFKGPGRIVRWEGVLLLLMFFSYQALLYRDAL